MIAPGKDSSFYSSEGIFMTRLSVNINKIATLRNARGGNNPDVVKVALDCERFGADGITVHPRPDERHIRRQDVFDLRKVLTTEFNIEGYPAPAFMELVKVIKPAQVTLVPDAPDQITSNHGWNTLVEQDFLTRDCSGAKAKRYPCINLRGCQPKDGGDGGQGRCRSCGAIYGALRTALR